jgi:hypothetical protein
MNHGQTEHAEIINEMFNDRFSLIHNLHHRNLCCMLASAEQMGLPNRNIAVVNNRDLFFFF